MASSSVPNRYRRDASTEMIRTKVARRKSVTWKENRYKKYEQNRHFGLIDVNTTALEERSLPPLDETVENMGKDTVKPKLTINSLREMLSNQRKEMLQQYKEKKLLEKMKEQRERARGGVFKVGLYRPDPPQFLKAPPRQKTMKPEPKKAIQTSVQMTRSKAKSQMEQPKIYVDQVNNGHNMEADRSGQKPTSDYHSSKERKALQPDMRVTRSAASQIPKLASSLPLRKPVSKTVSGHRQERKIPPEERPPPKIELKMDKIKDLPSKVGGKENSLKNPLIEESQTFGKSPTEEIAEFLGKNYLTETNVASQVREKTSFAPENFVFQPLDSLANYRIRLLSPQKEHTYVTPRYLWSPLQTKDENLQESKRETLKESKTHCNTPSQQDLIDLQTPPRSQEILDKDHLSNKDGDIKTNSDNLSLNAHIPLFEINEHQTAPPQHDVPYFRNILQSETERLTGFCYDWEQKLTLDIPDDAKDLIRTTVGQTRLLISERFKQFEGLVNDCDFKCGQKKITCMDLDGFWDMVNFQVEDVNKKFEKLNKLQESEWQEKNNMSQKVTRKKAVPVEKCKSKQDDTARTAARNRLAALKASMREKLKQEEPMFELTAPVGAKAKEVDKIVFDAGFFRIESPVKSFSEKPGKDQMH
ncbi:disks large-associated protein 5 isoform X2 [Macrotis lagotis]|uniref:disks large-associated protein 5 isoform X2 n=1 Tax=Macrotis lagotis TaxID=92651 RepID=UPI003D68591A